MTGRKQSRFNNFRDFFRLFLNMTLFTVSPKLVPDDHLDRTLMPEAVSRSFDELLYGGALFSCPSGTVCELVTGFHVRFCVIELENGDGYAVSGPYLGDVCEDVTLDELLIKNGVPLGERELYQAYLDRLPVVSQLKVCILTRELFYNLYGKEPAPEPYVIDLTASTPPACPVFEDDAVLARADAIRQRYDREALFMAAVARGDEDAALKAMGRVSINRLPNPLRNEKNLLIVLNTILRKSMEIAKVHPMYIDTISGRWAVRIEEASSVNQLDDIYYRMILDYCALVRRHSLAKYSHNVRKAINCINFSLSDPALSLKFIAKNINMNASYLSHQFNQEVGISVPEYIARMRIEQAQELLLSVPACSIGQIAAAVGMEDVNYFSKVFKRISGCTPSAYRKRGRVSPK